MKMRAARQALTCFPAIGCGLLRASENIWSLPERRSWAEYRLSESQFCRTEGSSRLGVLKGAVAFRQEKTDATARSADVKKSHRWAVMAALALFLCCLISLAVAQGPGAAPAAPTSAGPRIALLDVNYIIKNHERFKARMDEMMHEGQAAQKKLQAERADIIKSINEELAQFNKGSPEYQKKEEEIANRQAKFFRRPAKAEEDYSNARP